MSPETLQELAVVARDAYCRHVRHWMACRGEESEYGARPIPHLDGGRDNFGKDHRNVWTGVAQFLVDRQFGAEPYFHFHFHRFGPARHPQPKQITTEKAAAEYERHRRTYDPMLEVLTRVRSDQETFELATALRSGRLKVGWTPGQVTASILADEGCKLSPLFRFLVAQKVGENDPTLADLAGVFRVQAMAQFMTAPDQYEAVLGFRPAFDRSGVPPDRPVSSRVLEVS